MSKAWKDLERRKCRDLGGNRRPSVGGSGWAQGSDDDGSLPVALECKYTTRYQLRRAWVEQARLNGRTDSRPWLLAIEEHNDRHRGLGVGAWPFIVEMYEAWLMVTEGGRVPLERSRAAAAFEQRVVPARPSTSMGTSIG